MSCVDEISPFYPGLNSRYSFLFEPLPIIIHPLHLPVSACLLGTTQRAFSSSFIHCAAQLIRSIACHCQCLVSGRRFLVTFPLRPPLSLPLPLPLLLLFLPHLHLCSFFPFTLSLGNSSFNELWSLVSFPIALSECDWLLDLAHRLLHLACGSPSLSFSQQHRQQQTSRSFCCAPNSLRLAF